MVASPELKNQSEAGLRLAGQTQESRERKGTVCFLLLLVLLALFLCRAPAVAQHVEPEMPDYTQNPQWFPRFYKPYVSQQIPEPDFRDTASASQRIRNGKLKLSLAQLLVAVVENNLDIAAARYNNSLAETDVLRAKAGQAPRGVEGVRIPSTLFVGALGAGLGPTGGGEGRIPARSPRLGRTCHSWRISLPP